MPQDTVFKDEIIFNVKSKVSQGGHAIDNTEKKRMSTKSSGFVFTRKKRELTPEAYRELEKVYETVVVNDYGDEYHMSEEERKRKFTFYEAFAKVRKCKRKFHKLDEYVKAYRLCIDCLQVVANNNGIYSPDEFVKKVLRNQIDVYGLSFPKYIGKDRKDINWDYVSKFIADKSLDVTELSNKHHIPVSEMDDKDAIDIVFSKKHINKILSNPSYNQVFEMRPYDEEYESENFNGVIFTADKKDTKKIVERDPVILKSVKEMVREQKRRAQQNQRLNSYAYELSSDDFDYISSIDQKRGYQSESNIPEFKGDIMNRRDYKRYMKSLDDYENTQIRINYRGKMKTQEEINEIELKDALEAAGWNVRKLYNQKEKDKKQKKAYKRDKKRVDELKKRLMSLEKRQKKRKNSGIEFNSKKKKKNKKKNKGDD